MAPTGGGKPGGFAPGNSGFGGGGSPEPYGLCAPTGGTINGLWA